MFRTKITNLVQTQKSGLLICARKFSELHTSQTMKMIIRDHTAASHFKLRGVWWSPWSARLIPRVGRPFLAAAEGDGRVAFSRGLDHSRLMSLNRCDRAEDDHQRASLVGRLWKEARGLLIVIRSTGCLDRGGFDYWPQGGAWEDYDIKHAFRYKNNTKCLF